MKKWLLPVLALALTASIAGCAGSKVSASRISSKDSVVVNAIAIAPGSGVLGEAIAMELFNMGMTVIDADQTAAIVARAGLQEYEISTTAGYAALRAKGLEAVLVVKAVSYDDTPESASARVSDTTSGKVLAGVSWQNGWGGQRGSPADRIMRSNLNDAAVDIAEALYKQMH